MSFHDRFGAFPRLETPRLVLREIDPERDAAAHVAVWGDPEVVRYMPDATQTSLDQARETLSFWHRCWYEGPWILAWAIAPRDDEGAYVGGIRYIAFHGHEGRIGEVGYELRRDRWGRGDMTEALAAVAGFGFDRLGLHRVQLGCHPDNTASARVAEKAGFTRAS